MRRDAAPDLERCVLVVLQQQHRQVRCALYCALGLPSSAAPP